MMKTTLKFLTYMMMAFALVLTTASCDGEDGMDGAEGPQGEQGPAGQDGNANVIVNTVDNITWTEATYLGRTANQFVITDTNIDQNVLDNSLVLGYFQLFGDDIWYPMTYSFPYNNGDSEMITFTYSLNTLSVYALATSGPLSAGISQIKYVIIEGTSISSSLDTNDFEEVQLHYNLND